MPGFKGPRLPGWCTLPRWQGKGGLVETAKIEPQKGPSLVGSCIDLGAFGVSARHQVAMLLGKRPPWDGVREKSGRTLLVLVRVLWTWHKVAEVKVAEVKVVEVKVVDVNLVEVNLVEVEVVASQGEGRCLSGCRRNMTGVWSNFSLAGAPLAAGFEFFFIGGGWGQTGSTARRTKASAFGFVVSESAWHLVSGIWCFGSSAMQH
ncbi:hypothetical protein UVI_02003540 [Ustilaginoidea virens]|uniref:Uncharacterized protein n=1 Tax=Ustilaginoidea virens TaxID=1159556 RepID=A0A1B5L104_USTVR|nr:hypothetical protein UVI_02003540 [Ustilaginoidea virens]